MKTTIKIFLITLIILNFNNTANGQNDIYLEGKWINEKNELIKGKINPKITSKGLIEALYEDSLVLLNPEKIIKIYIEDKLMIRSYLIFSGGEKENIFIKKYLAGSTNLYIGKSKALGKLYFVEKNENIFILDQNNMKNSVKSILGDCPILNFENVTYSFKNITELITTYNSCKNSETEKIEWQEDNLEIYLGPKIGMLFGQVKFPGTDYYSNNFDFEGFNNLSIGLSVNIPFSKITSIYSELNYLETSGYYSSIDQPLDTLSPPYESWFYGKYINIPLIFKFRLLNKKIVPFIGIGADLHFTLNGEALKKYMIQDPLYTSNAELKLNFFEFGPILNFGFDYRIVPSSFISFTVGLSQTTSISEIYYYSGNQRYNKNDLFIKTKKLHMAISYNFKVN